MIGSALSTAATSFCLHSARIGEGGAVDDVHQARVALRRLRSDLRTFSGLVDPPWARLWRRELRELSQALGELRDLDVLTSRFGEGLAGIDDGDGAAAGVVALLAAEREAASIAVSATLDAAERDGTIDRLVEAMTRPRWSEALPDDATRALVAAANDAWRPLERAGRRAARQVEAGVPLGELHRLRLRAKRFRYAAEALAQLDRRAKRQGRAVTKLQDELGALQDAVHASAWLRDHVLAATPAEAFVMGQLLVRERAEIERRRRSWVRRWKAVTRPDRIAWME